VREPPVPAEREAMVLSALAPTYKARREDCQGEDVLYHILAAVTGSFTAPSAKEAAYLVASGACDASFPDRIDATHFVIVQHTGVVAKASGKANAKPGDPQPFYGTDIRGVADVDRDGITEILVTSTADGAESARLYSFAGAAPKRLRAFPDVYRDGCASGQQGKVQAQVLHYVPGAKDPAAQYTSELFEAPCSPAGAPKAADFQPVRPEAPPSGASATPAPATAGSAGPTPAPSNAQEGASPSASPSAPPAP
jgi:hypothetical protein